MRSERTTTTKPRKTRTVALPVAAAALALAAVAPTAAQAAPAETVRTQAVPAAVASSGPVGYHFTGYYVWKSDCENRGRDGVSRGEWRGYVCINGSWVPGDDYELWVRFW